MNDADRFRDTLQRRVHGGAANDLTAEDGLLIVVRHGDAGDWSSWERLGCLGGRDAGWAMRTRVISDV